MRYIGYIYIYMICVYIYIYLFTVPCGTSHPPFRSFRPLPSLAPATRPGAISGAGHPALHGEPRHPGGASACAASTGGPAPVASKTIVVNG